VIGGEQVGDQGRGVGGLLADVKAEGRGRVVDGGQATRSALGGDQGDGRGRP